MSRANIEIVMRNGTSIFVGFDDDEVVNAVSEKLKKAITEPNTIFSVDMKDPSNGSNVTHFIPGREIIRYSTVLLPRVAVPT